MAQVIDLISLKPFDMEAITTSVKKTKRVIIVEECMKTGGIGASLSATINESCFDDLDHQVPGPHRLCPLPYLSHAPVATRTSHARDGGTLRWL